MSKELQAIGEKIKHLRQSKLMTQQELAGTQITRNMLSTIEHGTALPSLPTALYLADRLGVPVGYLLADAEDEAAYRKMLNIANIRRAFAAKDYSGCLSLLNTVFSGDEDDELSLIRAECELGVALNAIEKGWLRYAVHSLDRALSAAAKTVYDTAHLSDRAALYFRYLSGVSGTLVSDVLDVADIEAARAMGDPLSEYIIALECIEKGSCEWAGLYIDRYPDSLYSARLATLLLIKEGEYVEAEKRLEALLAREDLTFGILLYEVFGDLELCYRKNDDYKKAYEFSGSRLGLLERLLEEV